MDNSEFVFRIEGRNNSFSLFFLLDEIVKATGAEGRRLWRSIFSIMEVTTVKTHKAQKRIARSRPSAATYGCVGTEKDDTNKIQLALTEWFSF